MHDRDLCCAGSDRVRRREFLRDGVVAAAAITLGASAPSLLGGRPAQAASTSRPKRKRPMLKSRCAWPCLLAAILPTTSFMALTLKLVNGPVLVG